MLQINNHEGMDAHQRAVYYYFSVTPHAHVLEIKERDRLFDLQIIDILNRSVPVKVTVNNTKRKIVFMKIDIDYIKRKKRENRETQRQRQQKEI